MELPQELGALVSKSAGLLGQVIRRELGEKKYRFIENLRVAMTETRSATAADGFAKLQAHFLLLQKLNPKERHEVAHSFTLMLELMNACENAYRGHRLISRPSSATALSNPPDAVIYVLTAHPTEARSPQNIAIFHQIQKLLLIVLDQQDDRLLETHLPHWLEIAWRTPVVRQRAPKVKDEAEHIYSLLFRDDVLFSLIEKAGRPFPFYVRSWVGGDKDGHPGVNAQTLLESLTLSRRDLLRVLRSELANVRETLALFPSKVLHKKVSTLGPLLKRLQNLSTADAKLIQKFKELFSELKVEYRKDLGTLHPSLTRISHVLWTFPALVVPLELRESSDVLMKPKREHSQLAIFKMLQAIEKIARGGDPRWYARGFIISMCESVEHIQAAAQFQKAVFGALPLPIIPLFEEASSLANSRVIIENMIAVREIKKAAVQNWDGMIEIMVGYSDSAKESGVLASRLAISKALPVLEKTCEAAGLKPVFFHGSGGSVDRGGGSIEDQTSWWPKSALRNYKVTIQGEMVERSLASPQIAKRQLESIGENVSKGLGKAFAPQSNAAVDLFAKGISAYYQTMITAPDFLKLVEAATPYSYLSALKIGSRPSKRATQLRVQGLRAIPWVLCWTQTRLLFPAWWGAGSVWRDLSEDNRRALKDAFKTHPLFTSYVKALGFTLAKVELNIWRMYLTASGLDSAFAQFAKEFELTKQAYLEICGQQDLMWFRPWLGESIMLRSAMIHPLNLLQILAIQKKDLALLRMTVTGISSGMMTTG